MSPDYTWYKLTPGSTGGYQNGTWSQVKNSNDHHGAGPNMMLKDGRFWIGGGEYTTDPSGIEIYDPVADTWTKGPEYPYLDAQNHPMGIYDGAATVLADGRVFCSSYEGQPGSTWERIAYVFDPLANTWSETFHGTPGPVTHEQGFTLLPDQRVFTISGIDGTPAFLYTPGSDTWAQGPSPAKPLTIGSFNEIGPQLLLHSGKVLVLGVYISGEPGTHSNIYDPVAGTWTNNVPDWPLIQGGGGFGDETAVVMPNGSVLTMHWSYANGGATVFDEYDPVANAFNSAPALPAGESVTGNGSTALALPNGQILFEAAPLLVLYTPRGFPPFAWRPVINSVTLASGRTYTVTGRQLNGLTTGASLGDDAGLATNYSLVRVGGSGQTYYFRSFNFNNMAPGQTTQFQFTVPASVPPGTYSLAVVASGTASPAQPFTL